MLCGRCGWPIKAGQSFTTYEHDSASAAGVTFYFHPYACRRAPHQGTQDQPVVLSTAPAPRARKRRRPRPPEAAASKAPPLSGAVQHDTATLQLKE